MFLRNTGARAALAAVCVCVLVAVMAMAAPSWGTGGTKLCISTKPNRPAKTPNKNGECKANYQLVELGGSAGVTGATGPTGATGASGPTGVTGAAGPGKVSVSGLIELSEASFKKTGPGWEAFRGGPGNYEVIVPSIHGTPVVMLTAATTTPADTEPPGGVPESPVIADAEHVVFDGVETHFNINLWRGGQLSDAPVYFTVVEEGAG